MATNEGRGSLLERPLFLKILSVFLAFILWFFVGGGEQDAIGLDVRRNFSNIPLSIRNMGTDMVVMETVENVTLSLQGVQAAFDGLTPADLEAYVDLSGRQEGWHEVRINAAAPPGVSVVRIEPAKANILLDSIVSRQMEIEANFQGEPAEGRVITNRDFQPGYVFVQGPGRKVEQVEKVIFNYDLEGLREDVIAQPASLLPVDERFNLVEGLTVVPDQVDVWVWFELPLRDFPVEVIFLPEDEEWDVDLYSVEPQTVSLRGPIELLDDIELIQTEPIDLEALEEAERHYVLNVELIIPEGLEIVNGEKVRVRFALPVEEDPTEN